MWTCNGGTSSNVPTCPSKMSGYAYSQTSFCEIYTFINYSLHPGAQHFTSITCSLQDMRSATTSCLHLMVPFKLLVCNFQSLCKHTDIQWAASSLTAEGLWRWSSPLKRKTSSEFRKITCGVLSFQEGFFQGGFSGCTTPRVWAARPQRACCFLSQTDDNTAPCWTTVELYAWRRRVSYLLFSNMFVRTTWSERFFKKTKVNLTFRVLFFCWAAIPSAKTTF